MATETGSKTFPIGGMWEYSEWEIVYNKTIDITSTVQPCPHCHSIASHKIGSLDVQKMICPRVIVVANEGGFDSTGLCLDCVLDAAKEVA